MKLAIPSDLLKLKKRFEAWRNTRAKRSKTPDRLLKVAAALLDHYSASMVCRVCGINLRTLRRRSSSKASTRRPAKTNAKAEAQLFSFFTRAHCRDTAFSLRQPLNAHHSAAHSHRSATSGSTFVARRAGR